MMLYFPHPRVPSHRKGIPRRSRSGAAPPRDRPDLGTTRYRHSSYCLSSPEVPDSVHDARRSSCSGCPTRYYGHDRPIPQLRLGSRSMAGEPVDFEVSISASRWGSRSRWSPIFVEGRAR
jgi:hypothetical protein